MSSSVPPPCCCCIYASVGRPIGLFSVSLDDGEVECGSKGLSSLFARRRNALSPGFYSMLKEMARFNSEAPRLLELDDEDPRKVRSARQACAARSARTPSRACLRWCGCAGVSTAACGGTLFFFSFFPSFLRRRSATCVASCGPAVVYLRAFATRGSLAQRVVFCFGFSSMSWHFCVIYQDAVAVCIPMLCKSSPPVRASNSHAPERFTTLMVSVSHVPWCHVAVSECEGVPLSLIHI